MQSKNCLIFTIVLALVACNAPLSAPTQIAPVVVTTPTLPSALNANPAPTLLPASPTVIATLAPTRAPVSPTLLAAPPTPAAPLAVAAISVANANTLAEIAQMKTGYPSRLIWSLDGQALGVITDSGFSIFNAPTFQNPVTRQIKSPDTLLDVSPDMRTFAVTHDQKGVDLVPIVGTGPTLTIKPGTPLEGVNYSPDGKTVVVASADEIAVTLWDAQSGQLVKKLTGFQTAAPVYGARMAPDGKTLLWISRATIQFMDIATGKLGAKFSHEDFVMDEALSPDGRTLITAAESTVDFWDISSGKKSKLNLTSNPMTLSLSPSGSVLAIGSEKSVLLWDAASQKQVRALSGHSARVTAVQFSHDGTLLASASEDGALKVWAIK